MVQKPGFSSLPALFLLEPHGTSKTQRMLPSPAEGNDPCLIWFLSSDHLFSFCGQDPEPSETYGKVPMDYKGLWIQTFDVTIQLKQQENYTGGKPVVGLWSRTQHPDKMGIILENLQRHCGRARSQVPSP